MAVALRLLGHHLADVKAGDWIFAARLQRDMRRIVGADEKSNPLLPASAHPP
jgi:hypothetical protein